MGYIVIILTALLQTILSAKGVTMIPMSEIGQRIKSLRENRGMSQQSVGDYCGVSRVAVTKWENGDTENMKLKNVAKMLKLFNICFDELTTGKKSSQSAKAATLINSLESDHEKDMALHALRVAVAKMQHGFNEGTQIPMLQLDPGFDKDSK
jgi:transcriptional regulator with XRE-family HTH domain